MKKSQIEDIEIKLLLEAILRRYGYDFRNYSGASLKRRIHHHLQLSKCKSISEMIPRLLHDSSFFELLLFDFSITVTEMFRDPSFYLSVRKKVIPFIKTYPFPKVWHAGCATGEEVYSMAILLKEEKSLDKATIYATDFNDSALAKSKSGIYPINNVKKYTANYQKAGGVGSFSEYYHSQYDSIILDQSLKKRLTFANHNLVTDGVFGEMNLILCRNVLIYFNKDLQGHVLNLFYDSLVDGGFLCLGNKETTQFSDVCEEFELIDRKEKIYRKKR